MTHDRSRRFGARQPEPLPDRVGAAAAFLRGRGVDGADVAVVLGSGLGASPTGSHDAARVPYAEIPHWPAPAVVGHAGVLVAAGSAAGG